MRGLINKYRKLDNAILYPIIAEFFLQLINSSFVTILLIYMEKSGYEDFESADLSSYRFLGVLLFAFPLGLAIKSTKILPYFRISSLLTPTLALGILYAISVHNNSLIIGLMFLWGLSFMCNQVAILPYILRNTPVELHTEAISLSYSTWSSAGILSGLLIFGLKNSWPATFDEKLILQGLCCLAYGGAIFVFSINKKEVVPMASSTTWDLSKFNWGRITNALVPTLIIAVGAGLTIPFVGLFFYKIHGVDSDGFALLSAGTTVIVFIAILLVPDIKLKFGYKKGISFSQSLAVLCLLILASTEFFKEYQIAMYIAMLCYAFRQPLMNLAGPLTSDLIMKYVGESNQEMISALTAAIWSGSWFISSKIFHLLRETGVRYVYVFLITVLLYAIAVTWYYRLVTIYENTLPQKKSDHN